MLSGQNERLRTLLFGVTFLLVVFVVAVPHRFLYPLQFQPGVFGILFRALPYVPTILFFTLICAALSLEPEPGFKGTLVLKSALVWLLTTAGSSLGSEFPAHALYRDLYYAITGVGVAYLCRSGFRNRHLLAARGLAALSGVVGIVCVIEFITGRNPVYSEIFNLDNAVYARFAPDAFGSRVIATVGHPVYLGSLLALVLPISLWSVLSGRGISRVLAVGLLLFTVLGLLLTFTRGAWLSGAIAGLAYLKGKSRKQIWTAGVCVLALLAGGISIDRVWSTFESRDTIAQLKGFRTDQRGVAYQQATDILSRHPAFGVGTGLYRLAGNRVGDFNDTPDNMYLRMLAEHGVIGFLAALVLFGILVRHLRTTRHRLVACDRQEESDLCQAVLCGLIGFFVDLLTCDALYFSATRISFWAVVGLGLSLSVAIPRKLKL